MSVIWGGGGMGFTFQGKNTFAVHVCILDKILLMFCRIVRSTCVGLDTWLLQVVLYSDAIDFNIHGAKSPIILRCLSQILRKIWIILGEFFGWHFTILPSDFYHIYWVIVWNICENTSWDSRGVIYFQYMWNIMSCQNIINLICVGFSKEDDKALKIYATFHNFSPSNHSQGIQHHACYVCICRQTANKLNLQQSGFTI